MKKPLTFKYFKILTKKERFYQYSRIWFKKQIFQNQLRLTNKYRNLFIPIYTLRGHYLSSIDTFLVFNNHFFKTPDNLCGESIYIETKPKWMMPPHAHRYRHKNTHSHVCHLSLLFRSFKMICYLRECVGVCVGSVNCVLSSVGH